MATGAAAAIAAAAARAEREIRDYFEGAGAFDPASAVPYDAPDPVHEREFEVLVGRGVLRPEGRGKYRINREAEQIEQERRRSAAIFAVKLIMIGVAVAVAATAVVTAMH